MPNNNATPVILAAGVIGAAAGWWLLRRKPAQPGEQLTLEILEPPQGSFFYTGARIDFTARALVGNRDISGIINWSITRPTAMAQPWGTGATTFVIPNFLTTQILEMQAAVMDPATGQSASVRRSVTVVVPEFPALAPGRAPAVSRVVPSFRRSDTGWQVQDRHVLEQPWNLARR